MPDLQHAISQQNLAATHAPTVLIICSLTRSILAFRGDLIEELKSNGYEVLCAIPEAPSAWDAELESRGIDFVRYPLARSGLNPLKDIETIFALNRIIKTNRIDLVFPYTIKPVIYGTLAARINRVPAVALITGLGFSFSAVSWKARLLEILNTVLYKAAISKKTYLIFQNKDDLELFKEKGIVCNEDNCSVVDGSGVNIKRFPQRSTSHRPEPVRFLMVARLIREKGVMLYIQAAQVLKKEFPDAIFSLVGSAETTPSAVDPILIQHFHDEGILRFVGELDDVTPEYQSADVFVLPSFYREGVPRSILEAMSSGLAIVTTDSPGCRETVVESSNGYLVETHDADELIAKLKDLIVNPEKVKEMGLASRKLAETRFNVTEINRQMLQVFVVAARRNSVG